MKPEEIKILIVDDEPDILEFIEYNLRKEGYKVITANNGSEAIEQANQHQPDLIILDIMMPVMDGIETCRTLRNIKKFKDTLIAFLTARSEDYSQIAGLDVGADDYITKPIRPQLLISRIKAILRRLNGSKFNEKKVIIGNLEIDRERYIVLRDGQEMNLPKKEFELLSLLTSKVGRVFTRDEIMDKVWGDDIIVGDRTIDVHIRKIREKLGDDYIKTIKGVGYKFNA